MSQSIPLNTPPCVIRLFISTVLRLSHCFDVGCLTAYAQCCCYVCSSAYVVHSPAHGVPLMVRALVNEQHMH
jgi:hypothetical protein